MKRSLANAGLNQALASTEAINEHEAEKRTQRAATYTAIENSLAAEPFLSGAFLVHSGIMTPLPWKSCNVLRSIGIHDDPHGRSSRRQVRREGDATAGLSRVDPPT